MAKAKKSADHKKTITVSVKGTAEVTLDDLTHFQGALKYLPDDNAGKLRESILRNGFRIPMFVWKNKILDGHQRLAVLKKLADDGYDIPPIPVVEMPQKTEADARKTILMLNSRYGIISEQGFYEFAQEFDLEELKDVIEIPEISLSSVKSELEDVEVEGAEEESDGFLLKVLFRSEKKFNTVKKGLGMGERDSRIDWAELVDKISAGEVSK